MCVFLLCATQLSGNFVEQKLSMVWLFVKFLVGFVIFLVV